LQSKNKEDHGIDPENLEDFRELTDNNEYGALEHWYSMVNPFIKGMGRARKACLLTVASGDFGGSRRERIHTLLVGPPGTGKSDIRNFLIREIGAIGVGARSSEVGLKFDARGEGKPGALNQANDGVLAIEELEKMNNQDALLEAMAEGFYEVVVGDKRKTLPARVRVVACANTTDSLSQPLLDRFDFIIRTKLPSKSEEKEITDFIYSRWFDVDEAGRELRDYLAWVRPFKPEVNEETMEILKRIKNKWIDLSEDEPNIRQKESWLRASMAIARLNRRDVEPEDFVKAIELQDPSIGENTRKAIRRVARTGEE